MMTLYLMFSLCTSDLALIVDNSSKLPAVDDRIELIWFHYLPPLLRRLAINL